LVAEEKTIEVAPGVKYTAWAYNGRVPGPTLRARGGGRVRTPFPNGPQPPHRIHFHGIHTARVDGVPGVGAGDIQPGESTTYEFDARPFGLHLYHCTSSPLPPTATRCPSLSTSPRASTARSSSTRNRAAPRPTSS